MALAPPRLGTSMCLVIVDLKRATACAAIDFTRRQRQRFVVFALRRPRSPRCRARHRSTPLGANGTARASAARALRRRPRDDGEAAAFHEVHDTAQQFNARRVFHCASVSGKCWPMSPALAAPSSASVTAWHTTSHPSGPTRLPLGTSTPPRITSVRHQPVQIVADAIRPV